MGQRSTIEDLPPAILSAVHAAIERGETIDAIVALIRGMGAERSRSAVGRYTKDFAELARNQRDMRSVAEAFGREFGSADDMQGRMMVQLMTSVMTRAVMPIAMGEDVDLDAKELANLAKAAKDITSAAKIDVEREARIRDEAAKRAKEAAAADAETAGRAAGASEDTLRRIRAGILGIAA
jgi:hypothetical protein